MQFWTRDNPLWKILLGLGLTISALLAPITNPADYGMTIVQLNWVKLIAAVISGLGGYLGNSNLRGEHDPPR